MASLSARNQLVIAIVVLVLAAAAVAAFLVLPQFTQASEVDAQIDAERANLAAARALVERRQSAKAQSAQNEVELMRIANQIPDAPQLPSVIIDLQDVANASGLEFPQITVGEMAPGKDEQGQETDAYSALPITLVLRGEWADLIEYYRKIDKLDRGVRITSSSFTYVPETDTSEAYVQANIVLEVYVMAASSVPPASSETTSPTPDATTSQ